MPARKPFVVTRYGRARLYGDGRYLSVDELRAWAVRGFRFIVIDSETRQDVTRVLLA